MTKQDYIKIADAIKDFSNNNGNIDINLIYDLTDIFSKMLKSDNSNFNSNRFINYIRGIK